MRETPEELGSASFEWIEAWYNPVPAHRDRPAQPIEYEHEPFALDEQEVRRRNGEARCVDMSLPLLVRIRMTRVTAEPNQIRYETSSTL